MVSSLQVVAGRMMLTEAIVSPWRSAANINFFQNSIVKRLTLTLTAIWV